MFNLKSLFIIFGSILYASPAYAYLDPGTGSLLVQGLIGGAAVVLSFLSIYWQKFKAFFSKEDDTEEEEVDKD